ncbi:MAG: alpha-amylase family glycosyl hydrolase [Halalkalicoccus sp.]
MNDDRTTAGDSRGLGRRRFIGGLGATAAVGLAGVSPTSAESEIEGPTAEGPGEPVIYQYFHARWSDVEADADLLADAGVDAVWLPQPANFKLDVQHQATAEQEGFYEPEHPHYGHLQPHPPLGYQPVDLREFDSPLGTEAELRALIETLHDRGIEVVLDAVLNHMANPDPAPADRWGDSDDPLETTVLDWPQFEVEEHFTEVPAFEYRNEGVFEDEQFDGSLLDLPNLNVRHPEVQAAHADYLEKLSDVGADGVRFDAAAHVWPWYFEDVVNPLCDELGLWRVGEVWRDTDEIEVFVDTGMDAFDFPFYYRLTEALETGDLAELHGEEDRGLVSRNPEAAVTFAQNHDTAGPGVGPDSPEGTAMDLANAVLLSYPGTAQLFRTTAGEDLEDPRIRELIWVKNNLASGELIDRHADSELYVYERAGNLLAGINVAAEPRTETVETSWSGRQPLCDFAGDGETVRTDGNGDVEITIPGRDWVMYAPPGSPRERGSSRRP